MNNYEPPVLNWDYCQYAGDDAHGVYYGALRDGHLGWWSLAEVDAGHFVATICSVGHFDTEKQATDYAHNKAIDWCIDNGISWTD